jgi:aryl-alcohol dehydrogenase-like predicted oxidoreductase
MREELTRQVAHIDALQIEYSTFCLDNEQNGLIDTARKLGVQVVAFSPLGAGFLTGKFKDSDQFKGDIRGEAGRFSPENIKANLRVVDELEKMASKKGCTSGQRALPWVTAQGAIPIPGTKNVSRLEENFAATNVTLSEDELKEVRLILDTVPTVAGR